MVNFLGVVAVALSGVLYLCAYWWSSKWSFVKRATFILCAAILSLPGLAMAIYYFRILPEWAAFYEFRSWTGSELSVAAIGLLGGAGATGLPRWVRSPLLALVLVLSAIPFLKPVLLPLDESVLQDVWSERVCLQSTPSTCGPAGLATLIKAAGGTASERDIARSCFSCATGTEAWYLARYARRQGFRAEFDFRAGWEPRLGWPALVGVRMGTVGHFIAVLVQQGDFFVVAEPLKGEDRLTGERLTRRYQFTGFYLRVWRE